MNRYLAKSNPVETIQEHTDKLLFNLRLLQSTYPNILVNWDMLETACIYHDLGKMNRKFQDKIENGTKHESEVAHNLLSIAFLNSTSIKSKYSKEEMKLIAMAVAYHHNRGDYGDSNYAVEVDLLNEEVKDFSYKDLVLDDIRPLSRKFFDGRKPNNESANFIDYICLKGLLNRLDYAASSGTLVEKSNDFLEGALEHFIESIDSQWNPLQLYMKNHQGENIVLVAQTGMGKTEAGLLWIGNSKGFFTLPLKTAINGMYFRLIEGPLLKWKDNVGLLHSDTISQYIELKREDIELDVYKYLNQTRLLSLPLTICTLDQLFDVVFRYTDYEVKLATLSYSKVIIDEIQMYSADLLAYLIAGLKLIQKVGGKFAIMTATLPALVTHLMKLNKIEFIQPADYFINDKVRHSIKVLHKNISIDDILLQEESKILVVCNTVKQAQAIYSQLVNNDTITMPVYLIHSKFIQKDRKAKEKAIMELGHKDSSQTGIWVATQVVEASLDIDFDYLFTELSDINGLFQRMGRCYRNREWDKSGYNCFVYIGDQVPCSGVKYVIDEDIHQFSRNTISKVDGILSESFKQELISEAYELKQLMTTAYYKEVVDTIKYVESIVDYELTKQEVKKRFRNIDSMIVIPIDVYNEKKELFNQLLLALKAIRTQEQREVDWKEKQTNMVNRIKSYTLNVNTLIGKNRILDWISINDYEKIAILDCSYDSEVGLTFNEKMQPAVEQFL